MKPLLGDHPLVQRFNQIKLHFRLLETPESKMRLKEFRRFVRRVQETGLFVAFDLLGSLNFGQSTESSDVDVVLYLICHKHKDECEERNCAIVSRIAEEFQVTSLLRIHLIDCVNLAYLDLCLEKLQSESIVARFAFYRSICRSVNARLLRPFHLHLSRSPFMLESIKPEVESFFNELTRSSTHNLSFSKYLTRVGDRDLKIPISIQQKIFEYLHYEEDLPGDS